MAEWGWAKAQSECAGFLGRQYGTENIDEVRANKHGDGWLVAYRRRFKGVGDEIVTEHRAAFVRQIDVAPGALCEWDFICSPSRPRAHRRDLS